MMIKSLYNRQNGIQSNQNLKRYLSWEYGINLELSKKKFQKTFTSNVCCLDLEENDGRYLLAGYGKGGISIYDTFGPRTECMFPSVAVIDRSCPQSHGYSVDCIQWYPNDTGIFVSLSADQTVKIWDANELEVADQFRFTSEVYSFHLSKKAKSHSLVAVTCKDSKIYLCDMRSGSKTHCLKGHRGSVLTTKWSPRRENLLVTGSSDKQVYLWDVRKVKSFLMALESNNSKDADCKTTAHQGEVNGLQFTHDGLHLLSLGSDDQLKLWDLSNASQENVNYWGVENISRRTVQLAVSTGFSSDLVFVPSDCNIDVFEIYTGQYVKALSGHFMGVNSCCYNSGFMELFSASADTRILHWFPGNGNVNENDEIYKDSWSCDES